MKGSYRSGNRLAMDLLAAIKDEGPVGVTRLLTVANLTHAKLHEFLEAFEADGWIKKSSPDDRTRWMMTARGERVLSDLRRVDAVMQDHGLGL